MENKKIYLVIEESVYEGETAVSIQAFSTREKAQKYYDDLVRIDKENDHLYDYDPDEIVIKDNEKDSYLIYEDGRYSEDHEYIHIEETIIDKDTEEESDD